MKSVLAVGDSNEEEVVEDSAWMVEIDVVSSLLVFMVWFGSPEHNGVHTVGQADAGGGGGGVL